MRVPPIGRSPMECENCAFWYVDVDEVIIGMPGERPYCHYSGDDQYAPCNLEDERAYEEPEHDEFD